MEEHNAREGVSRADRRTVVDVIKNNPLPLALIGVGVGLLVVNARSGGSRATNRGYAKALGGLAGAAQQTAGGLVDRGRHAAGYVGGHAQGQAERAKRTFDSMLAENPLAVGAVALAAGAVVAALLPHTEVEDRLMGDARDSFVESAQDAAHEALLHVRETTERLAGEAADRAKEADELH